MKPNLNLPKSSALFLVMPQNIFPKVMKMIFANVSQAFDFFLVSSGFLFGSLPWLPFFPTLFLIVES